VHRGTTASQKPSFAGTFAASPVAKRLFGQKRFFTHLDNQSPIKRQKPIFSIQVSLDLWYPQPSHRASGEFRELPFYLIDSGRHLRAAEKITDAEIGMHVARFGRALLVENRIRHSEGATAAILGNADSSFGRELLRAQDSAVSSGIK